MMKLRKLGNCVDQGKLLICFFNVIIMWILNKIGKKKGIFKWKYFFVRKLSMN